MHRHRSRPSALLALLTACFAIGAMAGCGSSSKDDGGAPSQGQPSGLKNGGNVTGGTKKG